MGYDFTRGRISHFPIDFCMGLTTEQRRAAACDEFTHVIRYTVQSKLFTFTVLHRRLILGVITGCSYFLSNLTFYIVYGIERLRFVSYFKKPMMIDCCSSTIGCLQCRQTVNCQQSTTNARVAEHM